MKPKNSYLRDARQGVGIGARLSNQQAQGHSHLLRRAVIVLFCLIFFGNWCASLCFQGAWLYIFIHPSASKEKKKIWAWGCCIPGELKKTAASQAHKVTIAEKAKGPSGLTRAKGMLKAKRRRKGVDKKPKVMKTSKLLSAPHLYVQMPHQHNQDP